MSLPADAVVTLDPAVELLGALVADHSLLCHTDLNIGMAVPPGEGLVDFVSSLMGQPTSVAALREQYDDRDLLDEMLLSLLRHRFARLSPQHDQQLVRATVRRALIIDLDEVASLAELCEQWKAGGRDPEVRLCCARLSAHHDTLRELAQLRAGGTLTAHHVVLRVRDVRCAPEGRDSLVRLGAALEIDAVSWPVPAEPISGLAELTAARIATQVVMAPDASILDEGVRRLCVEWLSREFVSGLCLRLFPAIVSEDRFIDLFEAVRALEVELGDVVVTNLPGDEVILGNADCGWLGQDVSELARRFRLAYLRWRVPIVKGFEGTNPWSQLPEVEDHWVRAAEDLLPNHPDLLALRPGSSIVDVCGGMGRVARRLAPLVGPAGIIISIEMRRFLSERARRFAREGRFTNLQFRPGLAERLPLPNHCVDAAVNEWTGAIWELGLGPTMVNEMVRVVRPGGRIAVTHRLIHFQLAALEKPWVQYEQIYRWVRDAFRHPELTIVAERVWGQTVPSRAGDNASLWVEQYLPRLVNPNDWIYPPDDTDNGSASVDVYLTMVAERR